MGGGRRGSRLTADRERAGARVRVVELRVARLGDLGPALGDVGVAVRVGALVARGLQGADDLRWPPRRGCHRVPPPVDGLPRVVERGRVGPARPAGPLASSRTRRAGRHRRSGDRRVDAGPAHHRCEVDDPGRVLAWHVLLRLLRRPACTGVVGHRADLRQRSHPRRQRAGPRGSRRVPVAIPAKRIGPRRPGGGSALPAAVLRTPDVGRRDRPPPGGHRSLPPPLRHRCASRGDLPRGHRGRMDRRPGHAPGPLARHLAPPGLRCRGVGARPDGVGRTGGGRALRVSAERGLVDRGATVDPVGRWGRLCIARGHGQSRPHPAASSAGCARTGRRPRSDSCRGSPRC